MNDSYFDLYILFHFIKKWKLNRSVHERRESKEKYLMNSYTRFFKDDFQ